MNDAAQRDVQIAHVISVRPLSIEPQKIALTQFEHQSFIKWVTITEVIFSSHISITHRLIFKQLE